MIFRPFWIPLLATTVAVYSAPARNGDPDLNQPSSSIAIAPVSVETNFETKTSTKTETEVQTFTFTVHPSAITTNKGTKSLIQGPPTATQYNPASDGQPSLTVSFPVSSANIVTLSESKPTSLEQPSTVVSQVDDLSLTISQIQPTTYVHITTATSKPPLATITFEDTVGFPTTATTATTTTGKATTLPAPTSTSVAGGPDPQKSLTLDARIIARAFANDGQDDPSPGQVGSLTSTNNFINFCLTVPNLPITNGKQITAGSCNPAPMGVIPSTANIPSCKFVFPQNFGTIRANTTFTIKMNIKNLETGFFVNAQKSYFSAPQQLNRIGQIQGHSHVVIEQLESLAQTNPTDPLKFAFFKGLNDAAVGGVLSTEVTSGLPVGFYRLASMNSATNHQPVVVAIAQHGSVDDMIYFTVTKDGQPLPGLTNPGAPTTTVLTPGQTTATATTFIGGTSIIGNATSTAGTAITSASVTVSSTGTAGVSGITGSATSIHNVTATASPTATKGPSSVTSTKTGNATATTSNDTTTSRGQATAVSTVKGPGTSPILSPGTVAYGTTTNQVPSMATPATTRGPEIVVGTPSTVVPTDPVLSFEEAHYSYKM